MKICNLAAVAGLAISTCALADSDWAAAVSGNWSAASNWSPADVPNTAAETATIDIGPGPYVVTLDFGMPATTTIFGLDLGQPQATLNILGGRELAIGNALLNNDGLINVNSSNSSSDGVLSFSAPTTITGAGAVRLVRSGPDSRIESAPGALVQVGANQTIAGTGQLNAELSNHGLVAADVPGNWLELRGSDKSNDGMLLATGSGVLSISGVTLDNTGGTIRAEAGSSVRLLSGAQTVTHGQFETDGNGVIQAEAGSVTTLDAVSASGTFLMLGGATVNVINGLTQSGTWTIDSNNSSSDAILNFANNGTLAGNGTVRLFRSGPDSQFNTAVDATVTQGPAHTIVGTGIIAANLVNNGTVSADVPSNVLDLRTYNIVNNADMTAVNNGYLDLRGITIDQTGGGMLLADAGTIRIPNGTGATIVGGSVVTANAGHVLLDGSSTLVYDAVTAAARTNVSGGSTLHVRNGLDLDGEIVIDFNNSSSNGVLNFMDSSTVSGMATLTLFRIGEDSQITSDPGATPVMGPNVLIHGAGNVNASLVNNGTISADVAGQPLGLFTNDKTNNGTMQATNAGSLQITNIAINNAAGVIHADDASKVFFLSGATTIHGGQLASSGSGVLEVVGGGTLSLDAVAHAGQTNIQGGAQLVLAGGSLVNGGSILVNSNNSASDAVVTTDGDVSISGNGTIRLNRETSDTQFNSGPGATITLGAGQTLIGRGHVNAALVNDGLVHADGGNLVLRTEPKVNHNVVRSTGAGRLYLESVGLTQSSGALLEADGGVIFVTGSSAVTGGAIDARNAGYLLVTAGSALALEDVTLTGDMRIDGGGDMFINDGVVNNTTIVVDYNNAASNAVVTLADGVTLGGSGGLLLNRGGADAQVFVAPGETGTIGSGQTITGSGLLNGTINIAGQTAPGAGLPQTMSHAGAITWLPGGSHTVRIASTTVYGRFNGSAALTLGGTLNVSFEGAYTPVKNHFFTIMTAGSVAGSFDQIVGPALPSGLVYRVVKTPTTVDLRIVCAPDLNADGLLDFFDVQNFLQAFSAQSDVGDYNEDGVFDFFDVQAFLNAFSLGCP